MTGSIHARSNAGMFVNSMYARLYAFVYAKEYVGKGLVNSPLLYWS